MKFLDWIFGPAEPLPSDMRWNAGDGVWLKSSLGRETSRIATEFMFAAEMKQPLTLTADEQAKIQKHLSEYRDYMQPHVRDKQNIDVVEIMAGAALRIGFDWAAGKIPVAKTTSETAAAFTFMNAPNLAHLVTSARDANKPGR